MSCLHKHCFSLCPKLKWLHTSSHLSPIVSILIGKTFLRNKFVCCCWNKLASLEDVLAETCLCEPQRGVERVCLSVWEYGVTMDTKCVCPNCKMYLLRLKKLFVIQLWMQWGVYADMWGGVWCYNGHKANCPYDWIIHWTSLLSLCWKLLMKSSQSENS